jgi:hypothetical protein
MAPTSVALVRLLAEPRRRAVVAALILADSAQTAGALSDATGLSGREVAEALERLVAGELVRASDGGYSLEQSAFIEAAKADADAPRPSEHGDQPDDVAKVLDTVFRDGRLMQWPAKRTKRLIVLDHLAQQFEVGVHYTEDEVNERLAAFTDDVATPRRYLVDEWFLDRIGGEYWRCGGSIPPASGVEPH